MSKRVRNYIIGAIVSLVAICGVCGIFASRDNNDTDNRTERANIIALPTDTNASRESTDTPAPTDTPIQTDTPIPIPSDTPIPEPTNTVEVDRAIVTAGESDVNLRSGAGLDFAVVGTLAAGQSLEIIGRNADSSWWQVSTPNGAAWIAASVVTASNANENIPILDAPLNQATELGSDSQENESAKVEEPPPAEEPAPVSDSSIIIVILDKDAEYADIKNISNGPIDLSGWRLISEKGEQNCSLGGVIQPNEILRIWALSKNADQGGYNCGFDSNIWNNSETDPAVLYDPSGIEVFRTDCQQKVCR